MEELRQASVELVGTDDHTGCCVQHSLFCITFGVRGAMEMLFLYLYLCLKTGNFYLIDGRMQLRCKDKDLQKTLREVHIVLCVLAA